MEKKNKYLNLVGLKPEAAISHHFYGRWWWMLPFSCIRQCKVIFRCNMNARGVFGKMNRSRITHGALKWNPLDFQMFQFDWKSTVIKSLHDSMHIQKSCWASVLSLLFTLKAAKSAVTGPFIHHPTVYCMHKHASHIQTSRHLHARVQLWLFALVFGDSCLSAVHHITQVPFSSLRLSRFVAGC